VGEFRKAKSATKMDIVKPMPPSRAMPNIWLILLFLGRVAILLLMASQATPKMPITLPNTRPIIMPMGTGCIRVVPIEFKSMLMPALASANRGMTIRAMGRCRLFSSLEAGVPTWLMLFSISMRMAFCFSCSLCWLQFGRLLLSYSSSDFLMR